MLVRRLMARSMTSVRPRTEHAISVQMGQPAACMIDNKGFSWAAVAARIMEQALWGGRVGPPNPCGRPACG